MSACTCGACISGTLSPRTVALLKEAANVAADTIRESLQDFPENQTMHDPDVYLINFLPTTMRLEMDKKVIIGFANYIETIAYVLSQKQFPKPSMITACVRCVPGTDLEASTYFQSQGGLPEYVLDAILETASAMECSQNTSVTDTHSSPACANDHQWDYLREVLFASSSVWPCGPYSMLHGGADEDEDEGWVFYDTSQWKPPPPPPPPSQ